MHSEGPGEPLKVSEKRPLMTEPFWNYWGAARQMDFLRREFRCDAHSGTSRPIKRLSQVFSGCGRDSTEVSD